MTTTPPPLPPVPAQDQPTPTAPRRIAPRVVAITAGALGALIALGTAGTAVASTLVSSSTSTSSRTLAVSAIDGLDVDVSAAELEVRFADVADAQLEVTGLWGADGWTFEQRDDELVVASPEWFFGMGWLSTGDSRAVLTLPEALKTRSLDADLSLSAGELTIDGSFADLDVDVSAGRMTVSGDAQELNAEVSAGRADLDLAGVQDAEVSVSAGELVGELSGPAPQSISVNVSAGSARLTLPDETYDVQVDVSAGGMDNTLATSSTAPRQITGDVSAGNLVLRPGN